MLHVVAMNLTPDLRTAQPDLGACDFGEVTEDDLVALLEKLRAIDPVQNHDAEPSLGIACTAGKFHVRTSGGKLFLYDALHPERGGSELAAAALARELAQLPPKPETPAPEIVSPPRRPRHGIAAAILCAGIMLNGYTLYSFFYIDDVNQKPPIVLVTDATELTVDGQLLGTPAYMAPERLCNEPYDGRSDVYSLGIVLHHMLAGAPPFQATELMAVAMMQMSQAPAPLREVRPDVPEALEKLVLRALEKYPAGRPDAKEFGEALSAFLPGASPAKQKPPAPATTPLVTRPAAAPPPEPPTQGAAPGGSALGRLWSKLFGK